MKSLVCFGAIRKFACLVIFLFLSFMFQMIALGGPGSVAQENYQWRSDDGGEVTASPLANKNQPLSGVGRGQNIRLRFSAREIVGGYAFTVNSMLQYATSIDGPWMPFRADDANAFKMTATSNYATGDATTAQLGVGPFVSGSCVEGPDLGVPAVLLDAGYYSEFEYCFQATAKAHGGTTYYFQMTGLADYPRIAELTMAAGEANEAPLILSPVTADASMTTLFTYTILASGSELITNNVTGLPAGLSFDGTNTISGQATVSGPYDVIISSTNAYGSDSVILALLVVANIAPTAEDQNIGSLVVAGSKQVTLVWGDVDTPELMDHTFSVDPQSLHGGTLESYSSRYNTEWNPHVWYYRAPADYQGVDTFTWTCNDGDKDSNIGTCTVTVTANTSPIANPSTASLKSRVRGPSFLNKTDTDPQLFTYTLVSGPTHGILETKVDNNLWYYTSTNDHTGVDSYTWKCNDGIEDSNIATVTINILPAVPEAKDQVAVASVDVATDVLATYIGGGGYVYSIKLLSQPDNALVTVSGMTFSVTPDEGYEGVDDFRWSILYSEEGEILESDPARCDLVILQPANDWPTFRANDYRNACIAHDLPNNLQLQWIKEFPLPLPAWLPSGAERYSNVDETYEPVVSGGLMFVPINRNDCIVALDVVTGAEEWRFYAEGPVRMAPVVHNPPVGSGEAPKLLFGSDDGWFYCLDAATGVGLWKRRAVPCSPNTHEKANRKVLGNKRMVSPWVVRGGPLLVNGRIYFASGLMPKEGVFVWCLDPDTGDVIWVDEEAGKRGNEDFGAPIMGFCPQGYLVRRLFDRDTFWAPSSKQLPNTFHLDFGGAWGSDVGIDGISGLGDVESLGSGGYQGGGWAIPSDNKGSGSLTTWGRPDGASWPRTIIAGNRAYTTADVAEWGVVGTVYSMLAANDRLFVVTTTGSIYCFGGTEVPSPTAWNYIETPLPVVQDVWTTRISDILTTSGVEDETGIAMVWGIVDGRAVEELLNQSDLHVIVIDPDATKIATLRDKLVAAGLYGTRAGVFVGDPLVANFPPYMARLVLSEDIAAAGFTSSQVFAEKVYHVTRPYGGQVWLPTTIIQHSDFSDVVAVADLPNADIVRNGDFSVLTRVGQLQGALEWTAANGVIVQGDDALQAPLGMLWWGSNRVRAGYVKPDLADGIYLDKVDVYTGLELKNWAVYSGGKQVGWEAILGTIGESTSLPRWNSWYGLLEQTFYKKLDTRCGTTTRMGKYHLSGVGGNAGLYSHDTGHIELIPTKELCRDSGSPNYVAANGVIMMNYQNGCACEYPLGSAAALVHAPQVENWAYTSGHRIYLPIEEDPILNMAINFGAPAEHVDVGGMTWVHQPHRYEMNTILSARFVPEKIDRYYHHSVRMESAEGPLWVAASGVKGVSQIRVPVIWPVVASRSEVAPVLDGILDDTCWVTNNEIILASVSK